MTEHWLDPQLVSEKNFSLIADVVKVSFVQTHHFVAPDKRVMRQRLFLFLHENICCVYSVEGPHRGTPNE